MMVPVLAGAERVLVLGLGKVTGPAVVDALLSSGVAVRVHESFPTEAHRSLGLVLGRRAVSVSFGEANPDQIDELLTWADLVVPSPGVPPSSPLLKQALVRGKRVISEVELGYGFVSGKVLAITGTNGKTTTTTLLSRILEGAGVPSLAVGNIGVPLVEAARTCGPETALVCEVSSFQLAFVKKFQPSVAIVLNVSDDHYDWHSGFEDYVAAKSGITRMQDSDDTLIIRAGDPGCLAIAANSAAQIFGFGTGTPDEVRAELQLGLGRRVEVVAGLIGGDLVIDYVGESKVLVKLSDIRLQGVHNVENVMAAALAALRFGVPDRDVVEAVLGFESLPHRTRLVATKNGVNYVNDSKATNPHATLRALSGLRNVVLIAGGRAKGLDPSALAGVASSLTAIVVMGEAAAELKAVFAGIPSSDAADIEQAVRLASEMARPGDTVLLSPACSSLDQYSSYTERGNRFTQAVLAL